MGMFTDPDDLSFFDFLVAHEFGEARDFQNDSL